MPEVLNPGKSSRDAARRSLALSVSVATNAAAKVGKTAGRGAGWVLRRFRARPTSTVAGAGFAALMVGIGLNALVLQKARHPAPLFDAPKQEAQAPAPAEQAAVAQILPAGEQLDRAPTGTLPPSTDGDPSASAAVPPANLAPAAPAVPTARTAADDEPAPKPAKKRHKPKTASKKSKGHDKISQLLSEEKPAKKRRHKPRDDE